MPIKENLVRLMKENSITIKQLACKTGISEPTLKRLRTQDNANPTLDIINKLSLALNIEISALIAKPEKTPTFYQDQPIEINSTTELFTIIFSRDTFNFLKGSKAIFRISSKKSPVTKYIVDTSGSVLEKVDGDKLIFRDEEFNNYSIDEGAIFAHIEKELYEVNYV